MEISGSQKMVHKPRRNSNAKETAIASPHVVSMSIPLHVSK